MKRNATVVFAATALVIVLDDNNYPFSSARTPGEPDPHEFMVIKVNEDLLDGDHGRGHHDDD